jgi:hypothetical protein
VVRRSRSAAKQLGGCLNSQAVLGSRDGDKPSSQPTLAPSLVCNCLLCHVLLLLTLRFQVLSIVFRIALHCLQEAVLDQIQLGAKQGPHDPVKAAETVQFFLDQRWESHDQTYVAAQEAVGQAVGQITKAERCKFSAGVHTLFKNVLEPQADSILRGIAQGHLKLGNPDTEQREALTSKLYNALTVAHFLVSIQTIAGTKVLFPVQ